MITRPARPQLAAAIDSSPRPSAWLSKLLMSYVACIFACSQEPPLSSGEGERSPAVGGLGEPLEIDIGQALTRDMGAAPYDLEAPVTLDAAQDAAQDMRPQELAPDMSQAPPPLSELVAWWPVGEAEGSQRSADSWRAPAEQLSFELPSRGEERSLGLWLYGYSWRAEEDLWALSFWGEGGELIEAREVRVLRSGRPGLYGPLHELEVPAERFVIELEAARAALSEGEGRALPHPLTVSVPVEARSFTLSSQNGAWLEAVALADARLSEEQLRLQFAEELSERAQAEELALRGGAPPSEDLTLEVAPCDDCLPEALAELLALRASGEAERPEASRGRLKARLLLRAGRYTLRRPLEVSEDLVWLEGAGESTELIWDPSEGSVDAQAALLWRGRGRAGPAWPLGEEPLAQLSTGARALTLSSVSEGGAPLEWPAQARWAQVQAEPYGPIPPSCVGGRDIERYQRHESQLMRVLSPPELVTGAPTRARLTLDRTWTDPSPLESSPALVPVELLRGGGLRQLTLRARCPEAREATLRDVSCANPAVEEDHGVGLLWVDDFEIEGLELEGFGRYAVWAQDTLNLKVKALYAHHASQFGAGGRGYGVHLISASRSLISDSRFEWLRHGVVIDFGSTDSQVLRVRAAHMPQALLDVHGEASRDTLIAHNLLSDAPLGVIVGGGGREVHCNDGPRHLIERNRLERVLVALSVSDSTRQVRFIDNVAEGCVNLLSVAFGAGDIRLEGAWVDEEARVPLMLLAGDGPEVGPISISKVAFDGVCAREEALLSSGRLSIDWGEAVLLCQE